MKVIEVVFAIVGFIGSVVSIWGAIKSRNEANKAQNYYNKLRNNYKIDILSEIKSKLDDLHRKTTQMVLNTKELRGTKLTELDLYEEFVVCITEILHKLPSEYKLVRDELQFAKELLNKQISVKKPLRDISDGIQGKYDTFEGYIINSGELIKTEIEKITWEQ